MSLKRLYQMLVARETASGTLVPNYNAVGNAGIEIIDPVFTPDVQIFERNIVRGTLTQTAPLAGRVEGTLTFQVELSGDTALAPATQPAWAVLFEACGMATGALKSSPISAHTVSAFHHGEVVTATGGVGGTFKCFMDTRIGQGRIRWLSDTETGTITNSDVLSAPSGAAATLGTIDNGGVANGFGYWPSDFQTATINFANAAGVANPLVVNDIYVGATSGTVLVALEANSGVTGTGVEFRIMDGEPTNGETFNRTGPGAGVGSFDYTASTIALKKVPSCTLALIEDATIKTMRGARGTVSMTGNAGEPVILSFEMRGLIVEAELDDQLRYSGATFSAQIPPKFDAADFQVGDNSTAHDVYTEEREPRVSTFTVDMANNVVPRVDVTVEGSATFFTIANRAPTLTCDPEVLPEGVFPFLGNFFNSVANRFRIRVGDTAQNMFLITMPGARATGEGAGDRDGIATREMTFSLGGTKPDGTDGSENEFLMVYQHTGTGTW